MQIWPGCTFGKSGRARAPERFVNSDGIQTLVMKLRFVQSLPGRNLTRVDFFAPPEEVWRTILRFLEKGFGTAEQRYKRGGLNQTLAGPRVSSRNRSFQYGIDSGGGRQTNIP